ncbi:MAG: aromatic acid exporter family protein, partial [Turicibacter sp.]|nr:aromatic acid exporter family protein [Turicibacter sp.]
LPLAYRFKMADGIVVNSVLVTHLWTVGSIGWYIILNSFALMAIGTAVAILLNSIMPNLLPQVLDDQEKIEARFREILTYFGDKIRHKASAINGHSLLRETGELLEAAKARADANQDNYLTRDYAYYSKYMTMRFLQFEIFLRMDKLLDEVEMTVFQTGLVADLTLALAAGLHEQNDGSGFMLNFERVLGICRLMALPSTREEFENRARLFAYLGEIRQLISIKQEFIKHVSEK